MRQVDRPQCNGARAGHSVERGVWHVLPRTWTSSSLRVVLLATAIHRVVHVGGLRGKNVDFICYVPPAVVSEMSTAIKKSSQFVVPTSASPQASCSKPASTISLVPSSLAGMPRSITLARAVASPWLI